MNKYVTLIKIIMSPAVNQKSSIVASHSSSEGSIMSKYWSGHSKWPGQYTDEKNL